MGKVIGLGLVALALVACSSKDDTKSEPTGPCAARAGKYSRLLVERDGTCGPIPEGIVTITPPN